MAFKFFLGTPKETIICRESFLGEDTDTGEASVGDFSFERTYDWGFVIVQPERESEK